jgi:integrase
MSSLYLRGKRIWIAFSDRFGIQYRRSTGLTIGEVKRAQGRIVYPREALDVKRKLDASLALGRWGLPEDEKRTKISELTELYMKAVGHAKAEGTQYLSRLASQHMVRDLGDLPIAAITEDTIQRWRRILLSLEGEQSGSRDLRTMSAVFSWAVAQNLIRHTPITRYVKVTPKPVPIVPFTDEQLKEIFKTAMAPARDQFRFLYLSGFRLNESCQLKWSDVDFKQRVIRLWNAKEKRWDYFPLDEYLFRFMRRLPRAYDPYVFFYRLKRSASQYFRRLRDRLKMGEELSLHTLRTNFISNLVNAGLSESEVMHLARHRSIMTTHRYYTAFDQKRMRKALERSRR